MAFETIGEALAERDLLAIEASCVQDLLEQHSAAMSTKFTELKSLGEDPEDVPSYRALARVEERLIDLTEDIKEDLGALNALRVYADPVEEKGTDEG